MDNNTQGVKVIEFGFSVDEVLKSVFAESAWRALRKELSIARPAIITNDNRSILAEMLMNSYVYLCSQLIGYIKKYNFESIEGDIMALSLALPSAIADMHCPAMQKMMERIITCHLLKQCYDTQGHEQTCQEYAKEMTVAISTLRTTLLTPSFNNI